MKILSALARLPLLLAFAGCAVAGGGGVIERGEYAHRADVSEFIRRMASRHGLSADELRAVFAQARRQQRVLELIQRPAEGKPWSEYRPIFLTERRIAEGVDFWNAHAGALARAERQYGVPARIIVAILGVETFYGRRMGRFPVLDALVTLGFDYPRRAAYFRRELENYLLLVHEEALDPFGQKGSYAGAMGMGQFMPSSYRHYAVDFDANGRRDLWHSAADAIGSVANYFQRHGWRAGEPVAEPARVRGEGYRRLPANERRPSLRPAQLQAAGVTVAGPLRPDEKLVFLVLQGEHGPEFWVGHHNFFVITEYNHSVKYALVVHQLGEAIERRRQQGGRKMTSS